MHAERIGVRRTRRRGRRKKIGKAPQAAVQWLRADKERKRQYVTHLEIKTNI